MTKYNKVKIKTKYKTKLECIDNCRDYDKKTIFATTWSKAISGEVFENGSFKLSSRSKSSAMFVFNGNIVEEDDGIYMIGEITPKESSKRMVFISIIFSGLIGLIFLTSFNPVGFLFGLMFLTVPWFNVIALKKSDYLYNDIVKKVC